MSPSKKKHKHKNIKHQHHRISRKNKIFKGGADPVNLIPLINLEPKYIIDKIQTEYLFEKRLICMISTGRNQQTYLQKIFAVEYFQYLLEKAITYLREKPDSPETTCLDKNNNIHEINLVKLFEQTKQNAIFDSIIRNSLAKIMVDLDNCEKLKTITKDDSDLVNTLKQIQNTLVPVELTLPMYHFYTGLIGYSHFLGDKQETIIDINKLFNLHGLVGGINSETTERKTIRRAELCFIQIDKFIEEHQETDLSKYNITDICDLQSVTDMEAIPFPNFDGTYSDKFYCVTEGNGRLVAIRIAIYNITRKHNDFIPPKIKISSSKFANPNGVKNLYSLLLCVYLNAFYNIKPPPGFKSQFDAEKLFSIDEMSEEVKEEIKEKLKDINYIFLFGFIPDAYETPSVRWDTTNTL